MTKLLTADQCARKLNLTFEQFQEITSTLQLTISSPEDTIPQRISKILFQVTEDLDSRTPQLPSSNEAPKLQEEVVSLSLTEAKTIAATHQVTQETVLTLQKAIDERHEKIILQEGYLGKKRELAIADTGRTFAMLEHYRRRSQELDNRQKELNQSKLSVQNIAEKLGINIEQVLDVQKKEDEIRLKDQSIGEDAAEDEFLMGKPGEILADFWTLMQLNLQSLGK